MLRRAATKSVIVGLDWKYAEGKSCAGMAAKRQVIREIVAMLLLLYRLGHPTPFRYWPRGGVVTQRTANPCTPVRFRPWPPPPNLCSSIKKAKSNRWKSADFVSPVFQVSTEQFQRFTKRAGGSARHGYDMDTTWSLVFAQKICRADTGSGTNWLIQNTSISFCSKLFYEPHSNV